MATQSDHESYKAKVSRSISNDRKIARGKELERRRIAERNEANRRKFFIGEGGNNNGN